ncbi:MAG: TonB family protein [Bacteroidetes bacterium]|nr:TonB family protein [Bacteroidota bacterium]
MTNNEIMKADLLDILFEHRNKSYGAYTLRRYYNNRLLIALGIALSAVVLFFLISLLNDSKSQDDSWDRNNNKAVVLTAVDLKKEEKEIPPPPPPPKKPEPVAEVRDLPIKVAPDNEADPIPDQDQIKESIISDKTVDGKTSEDPNAKTANAVTDKGTVSEEPEKKEIDFKPEERGPSYPGGPEALALFFSRMLSSPTDLEPGERKVVLVRFIVGADGSITKAEVIQSGGDSYDREVLRAFKRMPKWNPAIQNGIKVATSFTQPVTFIGVEQ